MHEGYILLCECKGRRIVLVIVRGKISVAWHEACWDDIICHARMMKLYTLPSRCPDAIAGADSRI